jgi:predicted O-methyltransferase YrrM
VNRAACSPQVQRALDEGDRWGVEQHGDELAPFCELLLRHLPVNMLEVGFRRGGTLAVWHELCSGLLIGVDLDDDFTRRRQAELEAVYPRLRCVLGDSHAATTLGAVNKLLRGAQLDALFIDGDHSAAGVRQDWAMYGPLLHPGGLVAFHDIQPNPDCAVRPFWDELRLEMGTSIEYNIRGSWGGIGVAWA